MVDLSKLKKGLNQYEEFMESEASLVASVISDLDEITRRVKNLNTNRERSLCITKLQEARMWLISKL